jgi:uncharacterized repeat protein (TIGR03803 family)
MRMRIAQLISGVLLLAAVAPGQVHAADLTTLASFDTADGKYPIASLLADAEGNLFGTTLLGGANNLGTVFEITKTLAGYANTPIVLVSFSGIDGALPSAGLIIDASGNLFGTAHGGANGVGAVYEVPWTPGGGYASKATIVVSFPRLVSAPDPDPIASLIADATGNLFSTTFRGGTNDQGTVFEVTGSGFVPPLHFAGTPGNRNCIGKSVSSLSEQYNGSLSSAAAALGYSTVLGLQGAIADYCGA